MRVAGAMLVAGLAWPEASLAKGVSTSAILLAKILAFDRSLPDRAEGDAGVLVLYKSGDGASKAEAELFVETVRKLEGRLKVRGLLLRAESGAFDGVVSLAQSIASKRSKTIFVCAGLRKELPLLAKVAAESGALIVTSIPGGAALGAAVALSSQKGSEKMSLVVNVPTMRQQGGDLEANVLRLATVIED